MDKQPVRIVQVPTSTGPRTVILPRGMTVWVDAKIHNCDDDDCPVPTGVFMIEPIETDMMLYDHLNPRMVRAHFNEPG